MSTGTCTVHSWNDGADDDEAEPKMGRRVDQRLQEDDRLYGDSPRSGRTAGTRLRSRLRSQRVAARNNPDDDDEDGW